jgi:hypothetical protein
VPLSAEHRAVLIDKNKPVSPSNIRWLIKNKRRRPQPAETVHQILDRWGDGMQLNEIQQLFMDVDPKTVQWIIEGARGYGSRYSQYAGARAAANGRRESLIETAVRTFGAPETFTGSPTLAHADTPPVVEDGARPNPAAVAEAFETHLRSKHTELTAKKLMGQFRSLIKRGIDPYAPLPVGAESVRDGRNAFLKWAAPELFTRGASRRSRQRQQAIQAAPAGDPGSTRS